MTTPNEEKFLYALQRALATFASGELVSEWYADIRKGEVPPDDAAPALISALAGIAAAVMAGFDDRDDTGMIEVASQTFQKCLTKSLTLQRSGVIHGTGIYSSSTLIN